MTKYSAYASILILLLTFGQNLYSQTDAAAIDSLISFCRNTDADEIMIVHKNNIIKKWSAGKCDSARFNTASMVKSWTGLVVGIMIDKGLIKDVADPVCNYIPEWKYGCNREVTIKDLLNMTAGINKKRGAEGILAAQNMIEYAYSVQPDTTPNVRFSYSNESVQLLGNLIEKVSGKNSNEYFKEVLFDPLEMDSTSLGKDPSGNYVVFGGASTTLDDAAKIGILMNNMGVYKGKRIISEKWIKDSVTPSAIAQFYGYLWWIDNFSKNKNYAATGDGGQLSIVFPELDLVFIRLQSCDIEGKPNMPWMGPKFLEMIAAVVTKED